VFLFFSAAEIGRFVAMLRNPSSILKACSAFALLQVNLFSSPLCLHVEVEIEI
jgi:hypothetical protein